MAPGFVRTKRVTDPFHDRVKRRIFSTEPVYASSGSEHSAQNDVEEESPCLSDLLNDCFLQEEEEGHIHKDDDHDDAGDESVADDSDCERDSSMSGRTDAANDVIVSILVNMNTDGFRNVLLAHVSRALEVFTGLKPTKQIRWRNVMAFLRHIGYNAAICKTKWENSGGLTAGNYEFIDVVRPDSGTRYFIDLDFAGEFEIARQTNNYHRLLQNLPRVFIGKSEELKQIVKLVSDSARRSLKSRELCIPPWRKNRFMQNKWFGPYRRTVNLIPGNLSTQALPMKQTSAIKCRSVGFNSVAQSQLLFPAATRTR